MIMFSINFFLQRKLRFVDKRDPTDVSKIKLKNFNIFENKMTILQLIINISYNLREILILCNQTPVSVPIIKIISLRSEKKSYLWLLTNNYIKFEDNDILTQENTFCRNDIIVDFY